MSCQAVNESIWTKYYAVSCLVCSHQAPSRDHAIGINTSWTLSQQHLVCYLDLAVAQAISVYMLSSHWNKNWFESEFNACEIYCISKLECLCNLLHRHVMQVNDTEWMEHGPQILAHKNSYSAYLTVVFQKQQGIYSFSLQQVTRYWSDPSKIN